MKTYNITPVSSPRMTQRDKWKKRPCVLNFFAFRDAVKLNRVHIPEQGCHVEFIIPMPSSWSKKKKELFNNQPHRQKPDIDNLLKALLDSVYDDDSVVWSIGASKRWGYEGAITIK